MRFFQYIPNALSFSRILLTPVFLYLASTPYKKTAAFCLIVAGLTDWLDGYVARRLGQESDFGAILDPVADKCLLISSYIGFFILGLVPLWAVILVVGRDVCIVSATLWARIYRPHFKPRPIYISKMNTNFQILHILLCLIHTTLPFPQIVLTISLGVTILTTLASAYAYARVFKLCYTHKVS